MVQNSINVTALQIGVTEISDTKQNRPIGEQQ
jgi:hypothetical protein